MSWQQLQTANIDDIVEWAEAQSWCRAMANCAQDAEWHAEGDVWTHTKLVLQQLEQLESWPDTTAHEKTVLKFAALFHDVAKPLTTQIHPETGRLTSPKHAVKGEHLCRSVLRDLGCDLKTRERISQLVRYHGRPVFLGERDEPAHEVVRLSWLVNNRLLFLLALADTRGRDSESMMRPEENLHFWRLMAEEHDCFDQPYPFATAHARFTFFRQPEPNLHYVPHEKFSSQVTLMVGLPGSGKDSWLARHRADLPVISLDQIRNEIRVRPDDDQGRVIQIARERCRELLRAGVSFAFNATNTMKQTRSRWVDLFADYHAQIEIVYVEPTFESLLRQNRARDAAVPEDVVRKLADKCEPPTWAECHALLFCEDAFVRTVGCPD